MRDSANNTKENIMIQFIYSIHDNKAEAYLPPFFLHNKNMAIRSFADCCQDEGHAFNRHPEDYSLWEIGEFDDQTGEIIYHTPHKALGSGIDYNQSAEIIPIKGEK